MQPSPLYRSLATTAALAAMLRLAELESGETRSQRPRERLRLPCCETVALIVHVGTRLNSANDRA